MREKYKNVFVEYTVKLMNQILKFLPILEIQDMGLVWVSSHQESPGRDEPEVLLGRSGQEDP